VFEIVVETQKELRSRADGMTLGLLIRRVEPHYDPVNRAAERLDLPPRRTTTYFVGECVRTGECVLERSRFRGTRGLVEGWLEMGVVTIQIRIQSTPRVVDNAMFPNRPGQRHITA
jgi:hypothetical protein